MTRRILVTRPEDQAGNLARMLEQRGLRAVIAPTVAIDAAPAIDELIASLDGADWLVITSANGAGTVAEGLARVGRRLPEGVRVAAVGPVTADALRSAGVRVDHVPPEYVTTAIAAGLGDLRGLRVVLAQADRATGELRAALVSLGAIVDEVVAYRTIEGPASSRDLVRSALQRDLAGIAFTSGSTVRGLMRLASQADRHRARSLPAFCIGPVTAEAARASGFALVSVANEHTAEGLARTISTYFDGGTE